MNKWNESGVCPDQSNRCCRREEQKNWLCLGYWKILQLTKQLVFLFIYLYWFSWLVYLIIYLTCPNFLVISRFKSLTSLNMINDVCVHIMIMVDLLTYRVSHNKVYLLNTPISQPPNIAQRLFSTRNLCLDITYQKN